MENMVVKAAMIVVGICCRTSNSPDAGPQDIPKLWGRFYSEGIMERIPNKISNEIVALYCEYEGDYTKPYTFVIGCPVNSLDQVPSGMIAKIVPSGPYALYRAIGEYPQKLIETWGEIWQEKEMKRAYTCDFELYGNKAPHEVDVYIAIKKEVSKNNQEKFAAVKKYNLPIGHYAITGSGPLGIRNLREIADIDMIVSDTLWNTLVEKYGMSEANGIKKVLFPDGMIEAFCESSFPESTERSMKERIADADIIDGLAFESLTDLYAFKRKLGRKKDLDDLFLIEKALKDQERSDSQ